MKARVAVHNFRIAAVKAPVDEGMKIADASFKAGEEAIAENGFRRRGLMVSLAAIFVTICGLYLAIRAIESKNGRTKA